MGYVNIISLVCAGCAEPVLNEKPADGEGEWRHGDGSALCFGTEPIELDEAL